MCIATNIRPAAKFITLRIGHWVLVYSWLDLDAGFSVHRLTEFSRERMHHG